MELLKIYLTGLIVLVTAIGLNILAKVLKIDTWYDFLNNPSGTSLVSYMWLFIAYPLLLGLAVFLAYRLLH